MPRPGWLAIAGALLFSVTLQSDTFLVNDSGTAPDAGINGNCLTAGGVCTLRAAIEEANASPALDLIRFSGSLTIVESALPTITRPVNIDGEANVVVIEGTSIVLGGSSDGSRILRLTIRNSPTGGVLIDAPGVLVASNTIINNQLFGVRATAANAQIGGEGDGEGNVIGGTTGGGVEVYAGPARVLFNFIGTNNAGTAANANSQGVLVDASDVEVSNNVLSGNGGNGLWVTAVSGLIAGGNRIGTGATGTFPLGNGGTGILLSGTTGATIQANVVSANNGGITMQGGTGNTLIGNFIGTNVAGTADLGNAGTGLRIVAASQNTIRDNVVAFNATGIEIVETASPADENRLTANLVFDNDSTGVDLMLLGDPGPTQNDPGDADNGANDFQNFPVLNCISTTGSTTTVSGSLSSKPSTTYRIEFFSNASCQSSSGRTYLGFTDVVTTAGGIAPISVTFPAGLPVGTPVTATATDPNGNTSEYSNCGFVAAKALFVPSEVFVGESAGSATVSVTRVAVPDAATVDYAVTSGTATAPADFTAVTGTLTFAACETSKFFTIPVAGDIIDEPDETATITFSNPTGATLNLTSATLVIQDDDATPVVTMTPPAASVAENGGSATLTFSLDHPSSQNVTVTLAFGGTAGAGDLTGAAPSVVIPATQTTTTLTITPVNDTILEGNETVLVEITGVTNAVEATPQASTLTIVDDDPVPTITINDVAIAEGNAGTSTATFTVTLSNPSASTITVVYTTADGTATAGSDYVAASGQLAFAPGVTTQTLGVTINGDTAFEANETFQVQLPNATGTGTILNDEAQADVSIVKSGPPTVLSERPFSYSLAVSNGGPDAATNVTATDVLPAGLTFVSATPSQGSCSGTSTVVCTLGTLAAGQSATVTLTVRAAAGAPVLNTATVSAAQYDPTPGNGSSTASAAVIDANVPTLSEWMLFLLAVMLACTAVIRMR